MSRILVVADETWVKNEVHAALSAPEHMVVDHENPATAVQKAARDEIDAVIVDLQVGSMGGMAVVRAIRDAESLDEIGRVPVVILTDRAADAFLARRAGADAWLAKPFHAHDLRAALATATESIAARDGDR